MKYSDNTLIAIVPTVAGTFSTCGGIALDVANNRYYVANAGNSTISIVDYYFQ